MKKVFFSSQPYENKTERKYPTIFMKLCPFQQATTKMDIKDWEWFYHTYCNLALHKFVNVVNPRHEVYPILRYVLYSTILSTYQLDVTCLKNTVERRYNCNAMEKSKKSLIEFFLSSPTLRHWVRKWERKQEINLYYARWMSSSRRWMSTSRVVDDIQSTVNEIQPTVDEILLTVDEI